MATGARLLGETYYPSCVVNMRIRFDEAMTVTPELFPVSSVNMNLEYAIPDARPLGGTKLVDYTVRSDASQILGRIPKSASIELPAYRQAGTFRMTFDFNDLPIDPRTVRSLAVEVFIDTVTEGGFAGAMTKTKTPTGANARTVMPVSQRRSMLTPSADNCVLVGLADSWQVTHTATGSEVSIEGRDLRGVFMDSPATPELLADGIDLKQNIVDVVRAIVSKHPYGEQMPIAGARAEVWPDGKIPSPGSVDGITSITHRVKEGKDGKKPRIANINGDPNNLNFWDLITRYCYLVGAVPYFDRNILTIKPARSLYAQINAGTPSTAGQPTPFASGLARNIEGEVLRYRRLIFGRNIEQMTVERKLGGRTPGVIEVVSLDTSADARGAEKLLVARWPNTQVLKTGETYNQLANNPQAASVNGVAPSGAFGKEDVVRISVPGITNVTRLEQLAKQLFEEIGRQELGGSVRTRSLASFGAGNEDPDLIRLRPGDAIQLAVDTAALRSYAPRVSPLNEQARTDANALVDELTVQFGGDANLARVVVATMRGGILELQNTYRVANVVYDWSINDGVSLSFDFTNYVVARNDLMENRPTQGTTSPKPGAPAAKKPSR